MYEKAADGLRLFWWLVTPSLCPVSPCFQIVSLEMELRKKGVLRSMHDLQIFWDHMLSQEDDTETSAVATAAVDRGQQGVLCICWRACVCICMYVLCVVYTHVCVCFAVCVKVVQVNCLRVSAQLRLERVFPSYYS